MTSIERMGCAGRGGVGTFCFVSLGCSLCAVYGVEDFPIALRKLPSHI